MIRFTAANYTSFIIYIRLPTYTVLLGVDNLNTWIYNSTSWHDNYKRIMKEVIQML